MDQPTLFDVDQPIAGTYAWQRVEPEGYELTLTLIGIDDERAEEVVEHLTSLATQAVGGNWVITKQPLPG